MKKTIPFTKTIHFKTMIKEVTDIEVQHNLQIKEDNIIEGDILVDGTYKIHEASQIEEEFHYNLPFTIDVDAKYNIEEAMINISDFYFEIINEEDLKINVELEISNVEEKRQQEIEEVISLDEEVIRNHIEKIPVEMEENIESIEVPSVEQIENENFYTDNDEQEEMTPLIEIKKTEMTPEMNNPEPLFENETSNSEMTQPMNYNSIFDSISTEETYVTYHVYIVRENDTLESILDKYKTTKEDLTAYNNLDNLTIGTKVIIPCHNE